MTFSDGEALNAAAVVDNITLWAKGDPSRGIAKVGNAAEFCEQLDPEEMANQILNSARGHIRGLVFDPESGELRELSEE